MAGLVLGALWASPAAAGAVTFTVDSSGDAPDAAVYDGVCQTNAGSCTFRAALEQSTSPYANGSRTIVYFSPAFDGDAADRVVISSPLFVPYGTTVEGGNCGTAQSPKPCVWVGYATPRSQPVLTTGYDPVIAGLAIGNGSAGIETQMSQGQISRNWIGVGLDGSPTPNTSGIRSISNYQGVIGGGTPPEGNYIVGGVTGLEDTSSGYSGRVLNNTIGVNPVTGAPDGPTAYGMLLAGSGIAAAGNTVGVRSGIAVQVNSDSFTDGFIGVDSAGRDIGSGSIGLRFGPGSGSSPYGTIARNVIGGASGPGLLIASGHPSIYANHIGVDDAGRAHPNGGPGILSPGGDTSTFGTLYGDEPFGKATIGDLGYSNFYPPTVLPPNTISNSGGPAIEILGDENDDNGIGMNLGTGNAGLFIDLGGDGPGNRTGVDQGQSAPQVIGASPTHATGRGVYYSQVYAYVSAPGRPGDLLRVLGVVDPFNTRESEAAGHWSIDYPEQPPSTVLAFGNPGTELTYRTVDGDPPSVRVRVLGVKHGVARLRLSSDEKNVSFRCGVDRAKLKHCASEFRRRLGRGRHRVVAEATDSSGNESAAVAKRFSVSR